MIIFWLFCRDGRQFLNVRVALAGDNEEGVVRMVRISTLGEAVDAQVEGLDLASRIGG